jgi:hypothetical protein
VAPLTDRKVGNGVEIAFAWIFAILTLGYLLPWAIAATRGRSNSAAIALVNFFVGWTLIGWIAALVMACWQHSPVQALTYSPPAAPGWYPAGKGYERYWDGQAWTGAVNWTGR